MRVRVFISLEIISSAHKTKVEFRAHFSGKKVRLMGREIQYIDLYVKYPFLLDFNETWSYRQIFEKRLNIKFHENRRSESGVVLYGQTEGQTDRNYESHFSQFFESP